LGLASGGAIVSGGSSFAQGGQEVANNAGAQIANTLLGGQPTRAIQPPTPTGPPMPLPNQAAHMLIQQGLGGPPSPVQMGDDGGPPSIP
jgi:hypothetical protein